MLNPLPKITGASPWYRSTRDWTVIDHAEPWQWPFATPPDSYLWEGHPEPRERLEPWFVKAFEEGPQRFYTHNPVMDITFDIDASANDGILVVRFEGCPTRDLLEWATDAARRSVSDHLAERARREAPAALAVLLAAA